MPTASEKAYREIRQRIASGAFAPGDRLSEEELSRLCGVSRTPVRDALRRLEQDFFVELKANKGAVVVDWSSADIEDVFEMRAMLEGFAARRAAERATPEQVAELKEIQQDIEIAVHRQSPDIERFLAGNRRFHDLICDAAATPRLTDMITRLVEQAVVAHTAHRYSLEDLRRSDRHHAEIVDAIAAQDGALAESIMRVHILSAAASFRKAET